jgi:putative MATE family efflux protein
MSVLKQEAENNKTEEIAAESKEGETLSKTQEQVDRIGTAKVSRLMFEFAIPAIIGLVVNGLYNIINSVFLGHAEGEVGLAVTTVAMPIMTFSMAVAILIGTGANALIALRLGEGKHSVAERILGNAFTLTIIAAIVCTVGVLIFEDPVLQISGAKAEIWEESRIFIRIISFGFVMIFFGMAFNNFIRTAGDPNRALYTMVAGTVASIILNFLFVMIFKWGVVGAGLATVLGQTVTAVMVYWYFVFSKKAPFKIRLSNLLLKFNVAKMIFLLGSAAFVLQVGMAIVNVVINNQLAAFGAESPYTAQGALAAIGVVQRVGMFAFFPLMGVAAAAQPIIGYNYGSKDYSRVLTTLKVALIWVMGIGVFFWLLTHLIPGPIVGLFGIAENLREFTIRALIVQMFMMPIMGIQILAANYFQSSGQPFKSMFISLTRQILFLIPLLYIMPMVIGYFGPSFIPLDGVYYAIPVADVLSVLVSGGFMLYEWRKLRRMNRAQKALKAPADA